MGDLLKGKVAVVTGAGRGIGRAHALALATEGALLVVNDVQPGTAAETETLIAEGGGEAVSNADSVADYEGAGSIVRTAIESFGRLDILVNNAGNFQYTLFHEMTEEQWDGIIAVHLKGTFNMCRHAAPVMMEQSYGRIINTASSQWRNPEGRAAYAAAKGGIVSLTYDLAWELRNHGITVNGVAPLADTGRMPENRKLQERMAEAGLVPKSRGTLSAMPEPEDNAPMVVYLASDLASGVNGCVFRVGGGKIALYSHPTEAKAIYRDLQAEGPWPLEELRKILPSTVLSGDTRSPHIPL